MNILFLLSLMTIPATIFAAIMMANYVAMGGGI